MISLKEYLEKDPTDRNPSNTVIFELKQGHEPGTFTCLFPSWS